MMRVIPQCNHWLRQVVFVTECAQAGRTEQEVSSSRRFKPQPATGKNAQKVPARKQQDVTLDGTNAIDYAFGPSPLLVQGLPSRPAITDQLPVRTLPADLRCWFNSAYSTCPLQAN